MTCVRCRLRDGQLKQFMPSLRWHRFNTPEKQMRALSEGVTPQVAPSPAASGQGDRLPSPSESARP